MPLTDPTAPGLRVRALTAPNAGLWLRRLSFFLPVAAQTAMGLALALLATEGARSPLDWALIGLLGLNLLYLALTGWPSVLGVLTHLLGFDRRLPAPAPSGLSRTALVMPIYNEDPRPLFAAMEVMARALAQHDVPEVDLFVLSDTRDEAIAIAERAEFEALRARGVELQYRRRALNTRRKVGNIADFCATWGDRYEHMIVLDADSLMGAEAVAALIGLMEAHPEVGIIQTVPYPVNRETLFARIQQFASRLYTPLLVEGLTFWQRDSGNYWGHNAIIRVVAFMRHCELPTLRGRPPFGGEILCHDVVEAGLMRRAGYEVWVLPELPCSYEALPANMVDYAQRERRWCQGNLQHLGVVGQRGLLPLGRYHLGYGVLHYAAGPVALSFLALATLAPLVGDPFTADLLAGCRSSRGLAWLTAWLVLGPKLLILATVVVNGREADKFGGRARLLASAVAEQISALLTAPVMLVVYTRYIASMLFGTNVGWDAQPRDDRGVGLAEAWRRLGLPVLVVGLWTALLAAAFPQGLAWAAPLIPGGLLAAYYASLTSRVDAGLAARKLGLFLTEDEIAPSAELRALRRVTARPVADEAAPLPVLPASALVRESADGD